ncbi:MAG: hypothetical protein ACRCU6_12530 [Fusobacteriaceae bacterium]
MEKTKIKIEDVLKFMDIKEVSTNRSYWLIRAGKESRFFEEFYSRGFTGIAWDKLNHSDSLREFSKTQLKDYVLREYPDCKSPGHAAGKIYNFINEIKKGDVVLMPSAGREEVAFGIIQDDAFYIDDSLILEESLEESEESELPNKRRKVEWVKRIRSSEIQPRLLLHLFSPHGLSAFTDKKIKELIDINMEDFFIKDNKGYLVFDIKTEDSIELSDLTNYFETIKKIGEFSNEYFGLNEKLSIQINVNSAGKAVIYGALGIVGVTGLLMVLLGADFNTKFTSDGSFEISGKTEGILAFVKEFNRKNEKEKDQKVEFLKAVKDLEISEPEKLKQILEAFEK